VLGGVAARASLWNRRRKLTLFLETMRPGPETRVVDVGVGDTGFGTEPGVASSHNFFEALYPWPERITAVSDVPLPNFAREFPMVRCVTASGTELPFEDDAFDLAFSNAVVEHVGARDEQRGSSPSSAAWPRRLPRDAEPLVPVETHTLLPFIHWLPRPAADRAFDALGRDSWNRVDLLTKRELLDLFPANVEPGSSSPGSRSASRQTEFPPRCRGRTCPAGPCQSPARPRGRPLRRPGPRSASAAPARRGSAGAPSGDGVASSGRVGSSRPNPRCLSPRPDDAVSIGRD
jgi:hypothetical protein